MLRYMLAVLITGGGILSAQALIDGVELEHGVVVARFRLGGEALQKPVELSLRAREDGNRYFVRAAAGSLAIGKVVKGEESSLAEADVDWRQGAGAYRLEARISVADRDDRGPAWFINAAHVPPMVRIEARVRPADAPAGEWMVSAYDDPIQPGKHGERYWDLDPFEHSSAERLMGTGVGLVEAPGVTWGRVEVRPCRPQASRAPLVEPVQRIATGNRGGCWLALGDLTGDGRLDYVVARNQDQAVTALTAYANDGRELWRWGEGGSADIAYDVPATVYDIDGDGAAEALCGIEGYLLVLDGRTGREKTRWTLPEGLKVADCIIIANLRGLPRASDILVKTRYDHLWAFTDDWQPLWEFAGNTGHHPVVGDVDGDGRDEVLCGFTLIDHDGKMLWQKDLPGHADAARLAALSPNGPIVAVNSCCGGNDLAATSLDGQYLWRQQPGITDYHFQTVHIGEIRRDVPGYEILVDEGWARPGRARLAILSAAGEWIGTYYVSYPRFQQLIDWNGDGRMEVAIPSDGLLCDGRGRTVARLAEAPVLGGPGNESPMARVADVDGDGRDELILFNAEEIVVYANRKAKPRQAAPAEQRNFTYY